VVAKKVKANPRNRTPSVMRRREGTEAVLVSP
jgi:hypothetical protein